MAGLILILPSSLPPSASEPDPEPPDVMEGQTKFIPLMEVCARGEREGEGERFVAGMRGKGGGGERKLVLCHKEGRSKVCVTRKGKSEVRFVAAQGGRREQSLWQNWGWGWGGGDSSSRCPCITVMFYTHKVTNLVVTKRSRGSLFAFHYIIQS